MQELFQKLNRRFWPQTIRNRFFVLMILLSIPPLFLLGFISYNIAKDTLVQNYVETNQEQLSSSSEVADTLFDNIIGIERSILMNDEVRQVLKESIANDLGKEKSKLEIDTPNVVTANGLEALLSSYQYNLQDIDSVYVYDLNNRLVFGTSAGISINEEVADANWYQQTVKANGRGVFFGYNVLDNSGISDSFSATKLLRDPKTGQRIGLLVINVKKSMFEHIVNSSGNNEFLIIDSTGPQLHMVYDSDPAAFSNLSLDSNLPSTLRKLQNMGYTISTYSNDSIGWTFASAIANNVLFSQSKKIGTATALISSMIAFFALIISYIFSSNITRPLRRLKKMMIAWSKGVQRFDETFGTDEIGVIGETFKRVVAENKELNNQYLRLVIKEWEAELKALQEQIKPHFLYNTLDSIYWMATLHNNDDIARMAIALSESFKISLNRGKDTISVRDELKHIEHYMTIQNIRFGDRFQFIQEVEDELLDQEILKLLLQPFVENAIYHGLEPKVGSGAIRLTGKMEGGYLKFTIEDDGVGMENMESIEKGYGVRNVRERLKLYYGPTSSLTITSHVNVGTVVRIQFRIGEGQGGMTRAESSSI